MIIVTQINHEAQKKVNLAFYHRSQEKLECLDYELLFRTLERNVRRLNTQNNSTGAKIFDYKTNILDTSVRFWVLDKNDLYLLFLVAFCILIPWVHYV